MPFGRIAHNTGFLHKIKDYIGYGKMFFLLINFLLVEDYELPARLQVML